MATVIHTPLSPATARGLRAGDAVRLSGAIYTARDAAHARLSDLLARGEPLPFDLEGAVIYYAGPAPARPGRPIGSCGPTTSERMDRYTPALLARGVRGTIGKGERSPAVVAAMRTYGAVYFAATGGAGALLARSVTAVEPIAFADLGTEAITRLTVVDFPVIVAVDADGNDYYAIGQAAWRR